MFFLNNISNKIPDFYTAVNTYLESVVAQDQIWITSALRGLFRFLDKFRGQLFNTPLR